MFSASIVDAAVRSCGRSCGGLWCLPVRWRQPLEPSGGHTKSEVPAGQASRSPGRSWRQKLGSGRSSVRPWRRRTIGGLEASKILANCPAPQKGEAVVLCQHCLQCGWGAVDLLTSTGDIVGDGGGNTSRISSIPPTCLPMRKRRLGSLRWTRPSICRPTVTEVDSSITLWQGSHKASSSVAGAGGG
ncbi:hypothetical protein L3Q82_026110 [Scortum barcoo]|uniref:Uncharacterized protein n=1 Tax=Scortum barcoo TaxID=214431 RepID=A0ACB8WN36_9TELE|nr:hypothetical protein L3Q82_026110 [Scortum barcoo]